VKLLRKLKLNRKWHIINIVGLSIAFACTILVFSFVKQQLSYDRFHTKAERIYRITVNSSTGGSSMHDARVAGDWTGRLVQEYPSIEAMVRLVPFKQAIVRIGDQNFYTRQAFATDSTFFHVFDFKLLAGNPEKAFKQPNRAFISKNLALKYFGNTNVLGKELILSHQQATNPRTYTIDGVMDDFPVNSHFHAEILTSFETREDHTTWAYTYLLMKKGADADALRNTIQQKWEKENESNRPVAILEFQKLADIHFFSHKSREMEKNGNIRSVILLLSGAIMVLFVALINFLNLSRVQFLAGLKSVRVKLINGAPRKRIAKEFVLESLFVAVTSVLFGYLIARGLSGHFGKYNFPADPVADLIVLTVVFIGIISLLSVFPVFSSKARPGIKTVHPRSGLYTVPMVIQFTLAVITITGAIVLHRQMDFISDEQPGAQNASIIVIPNNQWEAVARYETFKEELLKNPSITRVTAAMEEPGGDIVDGFPFEMEGYDEDKQQGINILTIDPGFFSFFGIKPLAGTVNLGYTPSRKWESDAVDLSFLENSQSTNSPEYIGLKKEVGDYQGKYILNESALKMMGITRPEDAVGKHFRLVHQLSYLFPKGIVAGVVPDFHYTDLHNAEKPLVIVPLKMFDYCFLVSIDPHRRKEAVSALNSVWGKINPEYPLDFEYITDSYQKVYAGEYGQTRVLTWFAVISIIISSLGIFALAAFSMQHRVKEIGIRKVNGARVSEVMAMLNKDFVKWVVIAFVIATPVAYYAMQKWLESFAYKTTLSWWIFALAGLLALGIALLTVAFQSWKAATKNPVESLRYE